MISDVLSEAVSDIREYLKTGRYGDSNDPLRQRIDALVVEMDEIRQILDTPPIDQSQVH